MTFILPPLELPATCPIIRLGDSVPKPGMVWAIGNFDGVHLGHQAVIRHAADLSEGQGVGILTFNPHPRTLFQPDVPHFSLYTPMQKYRALASVGVNCIAEAAFTRTFAALSAEYFVHDILGVWLQAGGVLTGDDFRFGAKRAGDIALLRQMGATLGFKVESTPMLERAGASISSTAIRKALAEGRLDDANAMLGRLYSLTGTVIHGAKLGRTLGFPTANIVLPPEQTLKFGVYAVFIAIDGIWHKGVASFGRRPSVDNGPPLFEAFVFDFADDLYGKPIEVALAAYLRPELTFNSLEALTQQMNDDAAKARALLTS